MARRDDSRDLVGIGSGLLGLLIFVNGLESGSPVKAAVGAVLFALNAWVLFAELRRKRAN